MTHGPRDRAGPRRLRTGWRASRRGSRSRAGGSRSRRARACRARARRGRLVTHDVGAHVAPSLSQPSARRRARNGRCGPRCYTRPRERAREGPLHRGGSPRAALLLLILASATRYSARERRRARALGPAGRHVRRQLRLVLRPREPAVLHPGPVPIRRGDDAALDGLHPRDQPAHHRDHRTDLRMARRQPRSQARVRVDARAAGRGLRR